MAPAPINPTIQAIRSRVGVQNVLDMCEGKPTLYMKLHGQHVSRNGRISVMSIYEPISNTVCLLDIRVLGHNAFVPTLGRSDSLKTILEDPNITKVFFDVRNDADALYRHYDISLQGVCDIQLMELGARSGCKKYVNALDTCITVDSNIS